LNDQKDEAMAKILRLNKQEKLLRERKQKMIAAGLNSMDELDALEALEAKEKEEREKRETEESMPQQKLGATESPVLADPGQSFPDPSFDPFEVYPPDDPFWQGLDFGGGTLPASQSSS